MKPDSNLKWTVAITIAVGYALPVHVEDSSCANGLLRSLAPYSQEPTRCGGTVASTTTTPGICNQAFERESGVFPLALFSGVRREISVSKIAISCIDATLIMDDFATNLLGPRERKSPADRTRAGSVDVYSCLAGPAASPSVFNPSSLSSEHSRNRPGAAHCWIMGINLAHIDGRGSSIPRAGWCTDRLCVVL